MSIKLGKYYICDRCGNTSFAEKIGEGDLDGGFTRYDKFEDRDEWHYIYPDSNSRDSKLLCPGCSMKYDKLLQEFFGDPNLLNKP